MLLLDLGVRFHGWPNDILVGFIFLFAMLLSVLTVRLCYVLMHRSHAYPNDQLRLASLGASALRLLVLPMLLCLLLLSARVEDPVEHGRWWALESVSRGWWCILRLTVGSLATLGAFVFESHWIFRASVSVLAPMVATCDLVSQAWFATQVSCIEHGLCERSASERDYTYRLAWRDTIGAVLSLTVTGVATWCWFLYGVTRQDLPMPRAELRAMSARLDKIHTKPKDKARRRNADEEELHKMIAYHGS